MKNLGALQDILSKEVTRQEFLKYVLAGLLALVGITNIVNSLAGLKSQPSKTQTAGYGRNVYGS